MKNEYEVRGDITAIIINSPKYGRKEALINTSKLQRAKDFPNTWYVSWNRITKSFYVYGATYENRKEKRVHLHRWVTNDNRGMIVDHFNHETLDNTDLNLRIVTGSGNQQNKKSANKNSKSGIRGVHWCRLYNKWVARITIERKTIHVGYFETIDSAEVAVLKARKKYMPNSQEASA